MQYLMTSLPLLLLVGVTAARFVVPPPQDDVDADSLQPIVTRSQARRVCVELCLSGLGGAPCGADCVDLAPQSLPVRFGEANASETAAAGAGGEFGPRTRHGACTMLCANGLGRPLCDCEGDDKARQPDFLQVCSFFCIQYDYRLYGCQKCSLYNETISIYSDFSVQTLKSSGRPRADFNTWCTQQCQQGNGGAACNCDILPMMKSSQKK